MQIMKRTLTAAQFEQVIKNLNITEQSKRIAFGVLVQGRPQTDFVQELNLTPGAISAVVGKVWKRFEASQAIPEGFRRVTAILPEHQAFVVMKWSQAALKRMQN